MPLPVYTLHESSCVRSRVGSFQAVGIRVARQACRVSALNVMARGTAFDIPPCQCRVPSAARTDANRHERSELLRMRKRFERRLIDITSSSVACCAEYLLFVARLTILFLLLRCKPVRKTPVQVVHFCQRHSLASIDRSDTRRSR